MLRQMFKINISLSTRRVLRNISLVPTKPVKMLAYVSLLYLLIGCNGARERHIEYYLNQWTAKVIGHTETATRIAESEGLIVREIPELPDLLLFEHPKHPRRSTVENKLYTARLESYDEIVWIRQVSAHKRETRNLSCPREGITTGISRYSYVSTDIRFKEQWYMQDCRHSTSKDPIYDINAIPVWYEENYLGFGITVLIVDDGLETDHPDLKLNYDPRYGLDLIDGNDTPDPKHINRIYNHGTKCAGVVGMVIDNGTCGTGVAPMVTLGAVRLLGYKPSNDLMDARALAFRAQEIHISSNSWGPTDDGKTMAPMGPLTMSAFRDSILTGRKGRGVIYIFAGGNGKVSGDMCGCDPFVNSMYTIAVASCTHLGQRSKYSERCAAIMVTAYSGDKVDQFNVISTDVFGECTNQHSGTSAAAPLVAGGLALVLESNHKLTWRDVQYLLVMTSEIAPLDTNTGWQRNNAGLWVSHDFGFGLVNIWDMVKMAKTFPHVPPMVTCVEEAYITQAFTISRNKSIRIQITADGCKNSPKKVNFLEHVQVEITLSYTTRGNLQINLISPHGTVANLLEPRPADRHTDGIQNWLFDSVQTWGESPAGKWTVEFIDAVGRSTDHGKIERVTLILHGTRDIPDIYKTGRTYYSRQASNTNQNIVNQTAKTMGSTLNRSQSETLASTNQNVATQTGKTNGSTLNRSQSDILVNNLLNRILSNYRN